FPQDFYDISRCYYMKTKNWDEYDFLSRLETKAGYYDDRKTFFNNFKQGIAF
ncbi:MAG TPA: CotS family spore coat protein, partial [Clostridiaceae bacterium]|nr:CotS family spore coat protein [Clostridiaceae bacterium]